MKSNACPGVRLPSRILALLSLCGLLAAGARAQVPIVSVEPARAPFAPARTLPRFAASPTSATNAWSRVERLDMPALNVGPLLVEDAGADPNRPTRLGIDRSISGGADTATRGAWSERGGRHVWRFRLRDGGARALRLKFARFELPPDGRLVVGDPTQSFAWEFGGDAVQPDGTFWTPPIPGDEILLEYSTLRRPTRSPLHIESVSHLYAGGYGTGYQGFNGCVAEPCHIDTACNSALPDLVRDAVGLLVFSSGGQTLGCSGSLMNDTDDTSFIPYLLTSNNCISTQSEASSLNVTFFYHSATCGGAPPDPATLPQSNGSTLLVTSPATDMTLLQLDSLPGGVGLNGWTTASPTGTLWGVHHPAACRKRISAGALDSTPLDCPQRPASDYHYGRWLLGHTEDGSIGSPLLDANYRVVGQLYGKCFTTDVDCGNSGTTWNWLYGRFDRSFPLLSPFLWRSGTWVDFAYTGAEVGTPAQPFDTLAEGLAAAPAGGHVWLWPGSSSVTPTVVQNVQVGSTGSATIGN